MSVIVLLGIEVFNEKIADFGKVRLEYQAKKAARPKRAFLIEKQEQFTILKTFGYFTFLFINSKKGL